MGKYRPPLFLQQIIAYIKRSLKTSCLLQIGTTCNQWNTSVCSMWSKVIIPKLIKILGPRTMKLFNSKSTKKGCTNWWYTVIFIWFILVINFAILVDQSSSNHLALNQNCYPQSYEDIDKYAADIDVKPSCCRLQNYTSRQIISCVQKWSAIVKKRVIKLDNHYGKRLTKKLPKKYEFRSPIEYLLHFNENTEPTSTEKKSHRSKFLNTFEHENITIADVTSLNMDKDQKSFKIKVNSENKGTTTSKNHHLNNKSKIVLNDYQMRKMSNLQHDYPQDTLSTKQSQIMLQTNSSKDLPELKSISVLESNKQTKPTYEHRNHIRTSQINALKKITGMDHNDLKLPMKPALKQGQLEPPDTLENSILWVIIGDSHMRQIFSALVSLLSSPRLKYRMSTTMDRWRGSHELTEHLRTGKYHEDIEVFHEDAPLRIHFYWDPFLRRLPQFLVKWNIKNERSPELILLGVGEHYMKASMLRYEEDGPIAASIMFQVHLNDLYQGLNEITSQSTVVIKLQDYIQENLIYPKYKDIYSNKNMDLYNKIITTTLYGTNVVIWDNTVRLSSWHNQACKKTHRRTTDMTWDCPNPLHVGYVLVEKYSNMLLNDMCNKFISMDEHAC